MRELSPVVSNWRSKPSLGDYLRTHGIPGNQRGRHARPDEEAPGRRGDEMLPEHAADRGRGGRRAWPGAGRTWPARITSRTSPAGSRTSGATDDPANFNPPYVPVGTTFGASVAPSRKFRVAAFDYGAKRTIYRKLVRHGFEVQVFPRRAIRPPRSPSTARLRLPLQRPRRPRRPPLHLQDGHRPPAEATRSSGSASATR